MRLGYFTMPMHPAHRPPAETLQEDREAIILADKLGFYDAFVGEQPATPEVEHGRGKGTHAANAGEQPRPEEISAIQRPVLLGSGPHCTRVSPALTDPSLRPTLLS